MDINKYTLSIILLLYASLVPQTLLAVTTINTNISTEGYLTVSGTASSTFAGAINVTNSNRFFSNGLSALAIFGPSGSRNVFIDQAGNSSVTGTNNFGAGYLALDTNVTGIGNICIGRTACLTLNGSGTDYNIGLGDGALQQDTTGYWNVAIGQGAGQNNRTGYAGVFIGQSAGYSNTTGLESTFLGVKAGQNNTTGSSNVFVGPNSGGFNTTGAENVAIGLHSGLGVVTGGTDYTSVIDNDMTFLGTYASRDPKVASTTPLSRSTALGYKATVGCSSCLVLGATSTDAVKVGIGTSSPSTLLSITSSGSTIPAEFRIEDLGNNYASGNTQGKISFFGRWWSGRAYADEAAAITVYKASADASGGSDMAFSVQGNGDTFLTERVRLTKAGNLAIGTTTPNTKLHVSSGANATTTVTIGELGLTSSKACVNMNQANGNPGSFYIAGGAIVVENNYCR